MILKQKTVGSEISFEGVGIHSGVATVVRICPAPANHGIQFERTDLPSSPRVPALWSYVTDTKLCTKLSTSEASIGTTEHLMAALAAYQIDNALIKINGPEVPIMDGSSKVFTDALSNISLTEQTAPRKYLVIRKTVKVANGDAWAQLKPHHNTFSIRFMFKNRFNNVLESYDTDDAITMFGDLAPARTFGFLEEVEYLRSIGLAKGGTLENAVVFDKGAIVNPEGLRFENECARHKALDVLGDLYLAGMPIIGRFEGFSSGHTLNNQLLQSLLNDRDAWSIEHVAQSLPNRPNKAQKTQTLRTKTSQFGT